MSLQYKPECSAYWCRGWTRKKKKENKTKRCTRYGETKSLFIESQQLQKIHLTKIQSDSFHSCSPLGRKVMTNSNSYQTGLVIGFVSALIRDGMHLIMLPNTRQTMRQGNSDDDEKMHSSNHSVSLETHRSKRTTLTYILSKLVHLPKCSYTFTKM